MLWVGVFVPEVEDITDDAEADFRVGSFVGFEEGVKAGFDRVAVLVDGLCELTEPGGSAFVVGSEFGEYHSKFSI